MTARPLVGAPASPLQHQFPVCPVSAVRATIGCFEAQPPSAPISMVAGGSARAGVAATAATTASAQTARGMWCGWWFKAGMVGLRARRKQGCRAGRDVAVIGGRGKGWGRALHQCRGYFRQTWAARSKAHWPNCLQSSASAQCAARVGTQ